MRLLLLLSLAQLLRATGCPELPPCRLLQPGLTVLLAKAIEPSLYGNKPIRVRLHTTIYGAAPGTEFDFLPSPKIEIRKGDLLYIEQIPASASPEFTQDSCLIPMGPYRPERHDARIEFFRSLGTPAAPLATLTVITTVPGATVTLLGPTGKSTRQAGSDGTAKWTDLIPGVYQATAAKPYYKSGNSPAPIELTPGSCPWLSANLESPYQARIAIRTRAGMPFRENSIDFTKDDGFWITAWTNREGLFVAAPLHPGTYQIRRNGNPTPIGTIHIEPGQFLTTATLTVD